MTVFKSRCGGWLVEVQIDGYALSGTLVGSTRLATSFEPFLAPVLAARTDGISATLNFGAITLTSPRGRASLLSPSLSLEGTVFLPAFRSLRLGGGIQNEGSIVVSFDGKRVTRVQLSEPALTSDFEGGVVVLQSVEILRELTSSRDGRVVVAITQSGRLVANINIDPEQPLMSVAVDDADLATLFGLGFEAGVDLSLVPKSSVEGRKVDSIPGASRPALAAFARHSFAVAFEEAGFARMRRYSCPELQ